MATWISVIIALGSLIVAGFVALQNRESHIDKKVRAILGDKLPRDLSERIGSIQTDLTYLKRELSELRADLKFHMNKDV